MRRPKRKRRPSEVSRGLVNGLYSDGSVRNLSLVGKLADEHRLNESLRRRVLQRLGTARDVATLRSCLRKTAGSLTAEEKVRARVEAKLQAAKEELKAMRIALKEKETQLDHLRAKAEESELEINSLYDERERDTDALIAFVRHIIHGEARTHISAGKLFTRLAVKWQVDVRSARRLLDRLDGTGRFYGSGKRWYRRTFTDGSDVSRFLRGSPLPQHLHRGSILVIDDEKDWEWGRAQFTPGRGVVIEKLYQPTRRRSRRAAVQFDFDPNASELMIRVRVARFEREVDGAPGALVRRSTPSSAGSRSKWHVGSAARTQFLLSQKPARQSHAVQKNQKRLPVRRRPP
jgi:hypothetical protein